MDRMSRTLPVFTSERGKAEVLDAYDAVLRKWPVAYTKLDVPTTFGDTHVIASGSEVAPPVVPATRLLRDGHVLVRDGWCARRASPCLRR
jgi:hypothetical protein